MKDTVRVMLVDPNEGSRQNLKRQLSNMDTFELIEVCDVYQAAIKQINALVPDMVIVVVDENLDQALTFIETVSRSHPSVSLVPAGSENDGSTILRAVRAGAREFVPLPVLDEELEATVRRICPRRERDIPTGPAGPRVIAVTGAAGGVGSTALAVNLATTLTKLSTRDTVLVDFDLLLGSLEECLGVIADNSLEGVARNLEEMDPKLLKRWLPRHECGLYVLPHPVSMEEAARLDSETLSRILALLKETFTTIVIDTSKGLQFTDFLAYEMADVILVVLQLNLNCTRNTVRLLQYFRQFEGLEDKVRLVVNRVNSPMSEISLKKAEALLKTPIRWQIPNATKLYRPARTLGIPIDEIDGGAGSKAHEALLMMAEELQPYPGEPAKTRRRLFSSFR